MNGAFLVHKGQGISSFGVIEKIQRHFIEKCRLKKRDLPKMGHGGTLDPFATGLLVVLVGRGVKLARYFLGSTKVYEGVIHFGKTTIPGDPTDPISETSTVLPESLEQIQSLAHRLTLQPYLQTPPMHSAKKQNGKPLYELARAGIEVERQPKLCQLYRFDILSYESPRASFRLSCSSGTYVRTLSQDMGRMLGTVAFLDSLHRAASGIFDIANAWTLEQILEIDPAQTPMEQLPCWIPFDQLLDGYYRAQATQDERLALFQGKQNVLFNILKRIDAPSRPGLHDQDSVAIYCSNELIAVARKDNDLWGIERVFVQD